LTDKGPEPQNRGMAKQRPGPTAVNAWWPAAAAVLSGWALIWLLLWFVVTSVARNDFPYPTGVSAMACWFVVVLLAVSAWELLLMLRGGPDIELVEPGMRALRRWWVLPATLIVGLAVGWIGWK
jgi:hypothetical protein